MFAIMLYVCFTDPDAIMTVMLLVSMRFVHIISTRRHIIHFYGVDNMQN